MTHTVIADNLQFPEGPAFDKDGNLYVVEIGGGQISKIDATGEVSVFATTGGGPNGANFGLDGNLYVCNNGGFPSRTREREAGRIERVTPSGEVSIFIGEAEGEPLHSPNDLAFDAHGNIYFTDPVWGEQGIDGSPPGHVCFSDAQGNAKRIHTGFAFPNGIGVTNDGARLIVCESGTFKLHAFDIVEPGVVGEPREIAFLGLGAVPDGFAFDIDGNLVCCGFDSGQIHVFGPNGGDKLNTIDFDDQGVTNVAFGGPDFQTLYVTESRAGRVVSLDWERPGMVLFPDR